MCARMFYHCFGVTWNMKRHLINVHWSLLLLPPRELKTKYMMGKIILYLQTGSNERQPDPLTLNRCVAHAENDKINQFVKMTPYERWFSLWRTNIVLRTLGLYMFPPGCFYCKCQLDFLGLFCTVCCSSLCKLCIGSLLFS